MIVLVLLCVSAEDEQTVLPVIKLSVTVELTGTTQLDVPLASTLDQRYCGDCCCWNLLSAKTAFSTQFSMLPKKTKNISQKQSRWSQTQLIPWLCKYASYEIWHHNRRLSCGRGKQMNIYACVNLHALGAQIPGKSVAAWSVLDAKMTIFRSVQGQANTKNKVTRHS